MGAEAILIVSSTMIYPEAPFPIKADKLIWLKKIATTISFTGIKSLIWYGYFLLNIIIGAGQVIYLTHQTSLPEILEVFLTFVFVWEVLIKMLVMYTERKKIHEMYTVINDLFWDVSVVGGEHEVKLNEHYGYVYLFARLHFYSSAVSAVIVMIFPPTEYPEGMRNLPTLIYIPFDANPSPVHEVLFAFFAANLLFCLFVIYIYDYLFIYFAQHLIVQLQMLKVMLEDLGKDVLQGDDVEKYHSREFQEECYRRLCVCVEHHTLLISFGNDLMGLASIAAGIQYTFSIIIGVVIQFLISWAMDKGNVIRSVKLSGVLLCLYNEMSIFAYHGSEIQYEAYSVAIAAYNSEWYLATKATRRGLLLLQMNAGKELLIMGFKLFEINNNSMIAIVRTTFSIVTFLQAMN